MKKLILLALVCTGFAVTTPLTAQALDSDKIAQYVGVASPLENRDYQYPNNRNRDYQYRNNRNRDRQFSVYYRNRNDSPGERLRQRQWTLESNYDNRRDARQAANRLERRGYQTYVQLSREVNRGNRG
ncbi:hypothetical protein [Chamaesiphon sp. OTE_20_metabat_361]|uniref:hypothetical protein n=1 Tax=Chamaesiphon sp. OTE_20_metabat_361 TaxID=2964689 RepID=UPI00286AC637|nr:hypothetical protein [Chamaesiphon sp. OTE_20_metabat_361]